MKNKTENKWKGNVQRVIPGFGISMGVTVTILSLVVLIPLASLVIYTSTLSFKEFLETILRRRVLFSFWVSISTAFVATVVNALMGTVIAWVLVRYDFPGKKIVDGIIELPFALPTAVAGISLTSLATEHGIVGKFFGLFGVKVAYTKLGIIFALIFVGIPFVVRNVQPVLEKFESAYEEAAEVMGASRATVFWKVIFPEIKPALFTGAGLAFGRCIGEYGSVIFIAGNTPFKTEIAPLVIMSKLQAFEYSKATSIALVMLVFSFLTLFAVNVLQAHNNKILAGRN